MDGEEIAIPLAPANNKYTGKETCDRFEMIYTYETPTVPATEVTVTYTVETDGRIHVQAEYRGQQGLPELPVFGMILFADRSEKPAMQEVRYYYGTQNRNR